MSTTTILIPHIIIPTTIRIILPLPRRLHPPIIIRLFPHLTLMKSYSLTSLCELYRLCGLVVAGNKEANFAELEVGLEEAG